MSYSDPVLVQIAEMSLQAPERFHRGHDARDQIHVAAGYADALYTNLVTSGYPLQFTATMLQNRGGNPTAPEFFRHLHALQDFVGMVNGIAF